MSLKSLVRVVGRHVRGLGDRRVDPLLRRGLDVDVLLRRDVVGGDEVVRQLLARPSVEHGMALRVDQLAIGQQLEARTRRPFPWSSCPRGSRCGSSGARTTARCRCEALLASDSEIVPVGAIELWCVKRAPISASSCDQLRRDLGDALHVAAVLRVQHAARDLVADLASRRATISGRLRSISPVTVELLVHDRRRALFLAPARAPLPSRRAPSRARRPR